MFLLNLNFLLVVLASVTAETIQEDRWIQIPAGNYTFCTEQRFFGKKMRCLATQENKFAVYLMNNEKHSAAVFELTYPDNETVAFELTSATHGPVRIRYHTLVFDSDTDDSAEIATTFTAMRADTERAMDTFKIRTTETHVSRKWMTWSPESKKAKMRPRFLATSWTLYPVNFSEQTVSSVPFQVEL